MNLLWILAAVVVLALAAGVAWRRRPQASGVQRRATPDALDTVAAWEPKATRVMTSAERLAYSTLTRALPDYLILAQVPLSRFLRVPTRYSYAEWLARVGQLCADLVVCDASSQVLAVVEVRPTAQSERGQRRFERMGRVLKAAGVPLHVWPEEAPPSVSAAREMLLPADKRGAPAMPIPGMVTASSEARAVGELRDPPPSTWFDDLDVRPAPTKKPPAH